MTRIDKIECRDDQIDLLDSFITMGSLLNTLVIYGINSGKSTCVETYFKSKKDEPIYIDCQRIMSLTKLYTKILEKLDNCINHGAGMANNNKCRNLSTFNVKLENLLKQAKQESDSQEFHKILIFTNYEQLPTSQLLNTIIGFHKIQQASPKISKKLSFIFMLNIFDFQYQPGFKQFPNHSILTINFSTYTRQEIELILTRDTLTSEMLLQNICKFPDSENYKNNLEQRQIFWQDFIKLILDVFYQYTGSDINSILKIICKIWPIFTRRLFTGEYRIPNDFIKMYSDNIKIFKDSEKFVMIDVNNDTFQVDNYSKDTGGSKILVNDVDLTKVSKLILCACYLAAYIPQKLDFQIFAKSRNVSNSKRKRRRTSNNTGASKFLLNSSSFDMERMISILFSIYENRKEHVNTINKDGVSFSGFEDAPLKLDVDFYAQISNLISLDFLNKTFSSSVNDNIDLLNPKLKLKVNFDWDFIRKISQDVHIKIEEYLVY